MLYKLLLFIILPLTIISAQNREVKNNFNLDVLNFYSPDSTNSRLDIYVEIPFENLSFKKIKGSDKFSSELDLNITIKDLTGNVLYTNTAKENIITEKTDLDYLSRNNQIITRNMYLYPGSYILSVSIKEYNSQKLYEQKKNVTVKDFKSSPVTVSDVMLVSKIENVNNKKMITPLVSRNISSLDSVYMFFYVYLNQTAPFIDVEAKILNSKNEQVKSFVIPVDIKSGIAFDNLVLYPFTSGNLTNDNFSIQLNIKAAEYSASQTSDFKSTLTNFPVDLNDVNKAIEQIIYIATEDEMEKVESGKTKADKQKRLIEFWKKKDPSPNTEKNEVLIEYYKRIDYSNKKFSTNYSEGWRSDMGMIYIIFGMPSNIERHPYEMNYKPYEVWDYYELNRQFIFVDNSGFGDYRLITPIWETFRYR